ncbi:hypothetical protein HY772_08185 [Candidatus Woesearchaeota archaeon]|nr:hypothetical protein [Candidatus Woesearchaeota archaeon]
MALHNKTENKAQKTKIAALLLVPLVICLGVILLSIFVLLILNMQKYEVQELRMDITIGNYTGVNLDHDGIHFGTSKKGEERAITREVIVINNSTYNKKVAIEVVGNISKLISVSDNYLILPPDSNRSVLISAKVRREAEYGTYTGILRAVFK